jgi:hypothetical protein
MKLLHRKSKLEKLIDSLESSELLKTTARTAVESAVANKASPRDAQKVSDAIDALELGKSKKPAGGFRRKMKTGLALTAGAATLVAVSATVSTLRGKEES